MEKKKWLDFSAYGAEAVILRTLDHRSFYILNGFSTESEEAKAILQLKNQAGTPYFTQKGAGGYLVTSASFVPLKQLKEILPQAIVSDEIPRSISNNPSLDSDQKLFDTLAKAATIVGENSYGDIVYKTPFVRAIKRTDKQGVETYIYEDQVDDPAAFFRVRVGTQYQHADLESCASAVLKTASSGKKLRSNDLVTILSAMYETEFTIQSLQVDKRAIDFVDRIDQQLRKRGLEQAVSEKSLLKDADDFEFLPESFVDRGFATGRKKSELPGPVLAAIRLAVPSAKDLGAAFIAQDTRSFSFLTKDYPVSSFCSPLQADLDFVKSINPKTAAAKTVGFGAEFTQAPDLVFIEGNPQKSAAPFEYEDLLTNRRDFALAYKGLRDRESEGLGFLVLSSLEDSPGHRQMINRADRNATTKEFLTFIGQRYELLSYGKLHHGLIEKRGPVFSLAMVAVGKKRDTLYTEFSLDADVKIASRDFLRSWDQVNQWASTTRSAIANANIIENLRALRLPPEPVVAEAEPVKATRTKKQPKNEPPAIAEEEGQVDLFSQASVERAITSLQDIAAPTPEPTPERTPVDQSAIGATIELDTNNPESVADSDVDPTENMSDDPNSSIEDDAEVVIDIFAKQRARAAKDIEEFSFDELLADFKLDGFYDSYIKQFSFDSIYDSVNEEDEAILDRGRKVDRDENRFQSPTKTLSLIREPSSMTPRNLVAPTSYAMDNLRRKVKDVDRFVSAKLRMTISEMTEVFSSEQVDAVALAIVRAEAGKGFICTDQTGLGKGRIIAAYARYSHFQGKPFMFITEGSHLFSDFFRDLRDIKSDHLFKNIMILNTDSRADICDDVTGEVIFKRNPATFGKVLSRMDENSASLADNKVDICFATYSQFRSKDSIKTRWVKEQACRGSFLALDESHNAAGSSSNTGDAIAQAVAMADSVIHSSATWAKNANTMSSYSTVFPSGMDIEQVRDILMTGGEQMSEIMSSMLAQDGALVRREHDLSRLTFRTVVDEKNLDRNVQLADRFAEILLEINKVSGTLGKLAANVDERYIREHLDLPEHLRLNNHIGGVESTAFGSTMYNLQRMFALCLKADFVADRAIEALRNGQKPVIVLEQTQESMLKQSLKAYLTAVGEGDIPDEYLYDDIMFDAEGNEIIQPEEDAKIDLKSGVRIPMVTMRNALMASFKRTMSANRKLPDGTKHRVSILDLAIEDPKTTPADIQAIEAWIEKVEALISDFPDLPLVPIDYVRAKIESAGFRFGEVSGRKYQCDFELFDGKVPNLLVKNRKDTRKEDVRNFNKGVVDALLINIAGASGISVHSNVKFANVDQRVMIEWQIANDVNKRVQLFGRVNRVGQVVDPIIETVTTGLPFEMRLISMQKQKLRELSANTQANRRNAVEEDQTLDLINKIGNESAKEYLMNNPDIAELLCIDMQEMEKKLDNTAYINKLSFLIGLLYVEEQIQVINELEDDFKKRVRDKEAQGESPLRVKEHEWGARVLKQSLFYGIEEESYESSFDRPVYQTLLSYDEIINPLQWNAVSKMVDESRQSFAKYFGDEDARETRMYDLRNKASEAFQGLMRRHVGARYFEPGADQSSIIDQDAAIQKALNSQEVFTSYLKGYHQRKLFAEAILPNLFPGNIVEVKYGIDNYRAVIAEVTLPAPGKEASLSSYDLTLAIPGNRYVTRLNLTGLYSYGGEIEKVDDLDPSAPGRSAESVFNAAKKGKVTKERVVLTGNLFAAINETSGRSLGSPGMYTDENDVRHAGIILRKDVRAQDLNAIPIKVDLAHVKSVLEEHQFATIEFAPADAKNLPFALMTRPGKDGLRLDVTFKSSKRASGWENQTDLMELLRSDGKNFSRFQGVASKTLSFNFIDGIIEKMAARNCSVSISGGDRELIFRHIQDLKAQGRFPRVA